VKILFALQKLMMVEEGANDIVFLCKEAAGTNATAPKKESRV
jgi:hypothetical protein